VAVSWKRLRADINRSLSLIDPDVVDLIFAIVMGRKLNIDPNWLVLVAASGSGKTEILKIIEGSKFVHSCTGITSNSLVSGYVQKDADGNPVNTSLLRILDGKTMLMKDMSEFFSKPREEMLKIMGILREASGGKVVYNFGGAAQTVEIFCRFQFLGACTSHFERLLKSEDKALGERFIFFRPRLRSALDHFEFVLSVAHRSEAWRKQLSEQATEFLDDTKAPKDFAKIHSHFDGLKEMAILAAVARSPVIRNPYRKDRVEAMPEPEFPARLGVQLMSIGSLVCWMGGNGQRVVKRICRSCIPSVRYRILQNLVDQAYQSPAQLQKAKKPILVDEEVIRQHCDELRMLQILDVRSSGTGGRGRPSYRYSIKEDWLHRAQILCGSKWMKESAEERDIREEREDVRKFHEKKQKKQVTKKQAKKRKRAEIVYIEDGEIWPGEW
jgi:hypothetical protein